MDKRPDASICERENDLIAFLYGEIDERSARDFERHLLRCAECESELGAFNEIRSSIVSWRQEWIGGVAPTSVASSAMGTSNHKKRSALGAIQAFFQLSPLWLKGSMAVASILFCVVSFLALAHWLETPKRDVAGDERRYSEKELQAKIDDALKSGLENREAHKQPLSPTVENPQAKLQRTHANRSRGRVARGPRVGRGPLTRSEREQLAADLRLTLPADDTDLELLGDGNN